MELRHIGVAWWRQRLLVMIVLLVTAAAVFAGVSVAPKKYTANATLSAVASVASTSEDDLNSLRGTLAELATSRDVIAMVRDGLPVERSYDQLSREITGQWVQGTVLVQVTVSDSDPEVAAEIANRVAQALSQNDPSGGAFAFTLSNPARPPATFSSPNLLLALGAGICLAVVLATCAALARDRRTYTIRDARSVEAAVGAPLLAHIPAVRDPTLQAMYSGTPAADVFRRLRISMEAEASGRPTSLVVVTGAASGDVNAWIAANLAISLATVGRATLLVDGRMGGGSSRDTALEPDTPGLYEVLRGAPLSEGLIPGPVDNLSVLPSGRWGAEPAQQLLETSFANLAASAAEEFDVAIVIAHPLHESDDAVIMAASGASIIVVSEGTVRPAELERMTRRATISGTRMLGAVLVGKNGDANG
ncbi:hypothetical protein BH09ACT12_BH09ACT12_08640 [soil metagenome]